MNRDKIPRELQSLPSPFLRLLLDDRYDKGDSEFSTTQLISPPQRTWIKQQGFEEVMTPTSAFFAVLGTILHRVLEDYARPEEGEVAELRIHAEIQGRKVSGCIDLYETHNKTVSDWKFIGGVQPQIKNDHLKQLHMNGYLAELHGLEVEHVAITYYQRDWKTLQALVDPKYPKVGIKSIVVDYDRKEGMRLWETTVADHVAAKNGTPRDCTLEEKWQDPPLFAVMKNGGKRAINNGKFLTMNEAQEKIRELKGGHFVQTRPAERTFCEHFCKLSHGCQQYKRESAQFIKQEEP